MILQSHKSCGVTWKVKYFTSPFAPGQWPQKNVNVLTFHESFPPIKSRRSFNTWPSELSDKLKTLNLQYSNANGHQTWQKGGLPWRSPTTKITCSLNYVILKDHVTIRKVISSLSQRLTPRNLAACWLKLRWFLPYSYMAKFWCKLALPFS